MTPKPLTQKAILISVCSRSEWHTAINNSFLSFTKGDRTSIAKCCLKSVTYKWLWNMKGFVWHFLEFILQKFDFTDFLWVDKKQSSTEPKFTWLSTNAVI